MAHNRGVIMAPTMFNLYVFVVAERWLERVCDVKGVGTQSSSCLTSMQMM